MTTVHIEDSTPEGRFLLFTQRVVQGDQILLVQGT